MDETFPLVASLAEVPEGELRTFDLPLGRVVVVHVEQELFALGDECPADGASLGEGELGTQEDSVICPGDGSEFDVRTGEPVEGPAIDPVPVFAVQVEEGWIRIRPTSDGGS